MLTIQADLILCSLREKPITAFPTGGRAYGSVLEVEMRGKGDSRL